MYEEILDHEEGPSNDRFYKKSKKNLMVAGILILLSIVILYLTLEVFIIRQYIPALGFILFFVGILSSAVGVFNGIRSFIKKEKNTIGKYIVFLVNLVISGLFFLVLLANIMDLIRVFGS